MSEVRCGHPAVDLLPWYANGSLHGDEAAEVRAHVESCRICASQLDELLVLGRVIESEGIPLLSEARGEGMTAPSIARTRLAYGAAAALALPAALGIWWGLLGFPGVDRTSPGAGTPAPPQIPGAASEVSAPKEGLMQSALLDLAGGALRGTGAGAVFPAPVSVESVQIVFSVPVNPDARYKVLLRGPSGEILSREDEHLPLDFDGSARYTLPARLLQEPGPYVLVAVEKPPGRPEREFLFPFEIESPVSP